MKKSVTFPGPGTGMAVAAGLAAYGAGVGELPNSTEIIWLLVAATVVIEAMHAIVVPLGRRLFARYDAGVVETDSVGETGSAD